LANSFRIEPLLVDLEIGTTKEIRWEFLDRKTNGFGGAGEALVADWALSEFPTNQRKQLRLRAVVESRHCFGPSAFNKRAALIVARKRVDWGCTARDAPLSFTGHRVTTTAAERVRLAVSVSEARLFG
jgi:hypothetical protein